MKKRLFAIFVALCMALSLLPMTALAVTATQPTAGDGSTGNPYVIASAANLYWFAQQVNNSGRTDISAKLTDDIDLLGQAWTPIGNYSYPYRGTFDGQEHTISNLTYSGSVSYEGLFGYVIEGTVTNLTIDHADVTTSSGKYGAGIVVGNLTRGTVSNVTVTDSTITRSSGDTLDICLGGVVGFNGGTIIHCSTDDRTRVTDNGSGNFVGGIAGQNGTKDVDSEVGRIEDCSNSATVSTTSGYACVGGIVGKNTNTTTQDSVVRNCTNSGTVNGATGWGGSRVGGIVGDNDGLTADCVNSGTITSKNVSAETSSNTEFSAGGVVGSNDGKVERCGNTGTVSGGQHYGGVVGYFNNSAGYIKDCWNTGALVQAVNCSGTISAGGIVGHLLDGTVSNCWSSTSYTPFNSTAATFHPQYAVVGVKETYLNGRSYSGSAVDCYYSDPSDRTGSEPADDDINGTNGVSTTAVTDGRLALLLNGTSRLGENSLWRQNLGSDTYPVLDTSHAIVWQLCVDKNPSNNKEATAHEFDENSNGFCKRGDDGYEPATLVTASNYETLGLTAGYVGYYAIANAGQLYWFSDATTYHTKTFEDIGANANAVLVADIKVNENVLESIPDENGLPSDNLISAFRLWRPIGNDDRTARPFSGTFDGNGKTVSGLYGRYAGGLGLDSSRNFSDPNYYTGVIGVLTDGGCVRNLTVTDSYFYGDRAGGIVGTVAVKSETGTAVIMDCQFDGTVFGGFSFVGGIAGYIESLGNVEVSGCRSAGASFAIISGGLIGAAVGNVTVSDCQLSSGTIFGGDSGGLIGAAMGNETTKVTIDGCVFDGAATGGYVGGIIGEFGNSGSVEIKDSVSMGLVTQVEGSSNYCGGVFGAFKDSTLVSFENVLYLRQPDSAENAGYACDTVSGYYTYTEQLPAGIAMFDLTAPEYNTPINAQTAEGSMFRSSLFSLTGDLLPVLSDTDLVFGAVGTKGLTVTLANGLASTIQVTVSPKDLSTSAIVTGVQDVYASADAAAAAEPGIHVFDGDTLLTAETDYTVNNENNQFTITFLGNYKGTKTHSYTIHEGLEIAAFDYTGAYDGTAHGVTVNAPEGTSVTYSTQENGEYTETAITRTDVGRQVVYWKAVKDGKTVQGASLISITPATLTIKADHKAIYVGGALPEYTYTVTGWQGSDNTLTTEPTVACEADGKTAGTYTITVSGANAGDNYTINYVDGTLTVYAPSYGSVTTYPVTAPAADNGTVTVTPASGSKGTTVTVTVTPDEGYKLDTLTVTDADGNKLTLTDKGDGKFTFTMPASKVTVNAAFTEIGDSCDGGADCPSHGFADVNTNLWYHEAIDYVVENGIMNGVGDGKFDPNGNLSRSMLMTMLARLDGVDTTGSSPWYQKGLNWAVETGISDGTNPGSDISRQEVATMLYRYAQLKGYDTSKSSGLNAFVDGDQTASWAQEAMEWAVANGIFQGDDNHVLNPKGSATRAEVAQILMNFCKNVVK